MSHLSHALQRSLDDLNWSLVDLSRESGLHTSSLSLYVSGTRPVGPRAIQQFLAAFPEDRRPHILRAWLLDMIPRDEYRQLLDINPRVGLVEERNHGLDLSSYPDDIRSALELLARKTVKKAVRELILNLADILRDDP